MQKTRRLKPTGKSPDENKREPSRGKGKGPAKPPQGRERRPSRAEREKMPIRLNRYLASCGLASRRKADEHIAAGEVKVNGKVVTELGSKIIRGQDKVTFRGKEMLPQNYVYILLNKPKNHITTTSDEKGRRTVMDILQHKYKERLYPVGRLDRNTTGLLLLTNDGDLADKLTHPSQNIAKIYHVRLDKVVPPDHLDLLRGGVDLEDGHARVDKIDYVTGTDGREIGLEIHSGRNRIVRRMFEYLGYKVEKLDRVSFASLTKKNLPRGKWRELSDKEIAFLKMMGSK